MQGDRGIATECLRFCSRSEESTERTEWSNVVIFRPRSPKVLQSSTGLTRVALHGFAALSAPHTHACPPSVPEAPSSLMGDPCKILGGIEPGITARFCGFDDVHSQLRQLSIPVSFEEFYHGLRCWRVRQAVRTALAEEKNVFEIMERAKEAVTPLTNAFLAPSGDGAALDFSRPKFARILEMLWRVEVCARMATVAKLRVKAAERIAIDAVVKDHGDPRYFKVNGQGDAPYQSTRLYGNTFFCLTGPGVRPVLRLSLIHI